jgi:hypothetical protein
LGNSRRLLFKAKRQNGIDPHQWLTDKIHAR